MKPFKFFIIAGEASGDLHASNLMKALRKKDAHVSFVGLGGDKMRAEGCDIRVDYREMAYMGILAVLSNLDKVKRNFCIAKQTLLKEQPDALILIDYPSFNLKIAKFCKNHLPNTKVIYYIPPKIWAWKKWRVHSIAKYCDEILGIFPFEPAFYAKYGYKCHYVGNPTADCIREFTATSPTGNDTPTIAILPGSRRSEISHCLPIMLEAARKVAGEQYHIIVTAAPGIEDAFYQSFLLHDETLTRDTYNIVAHAQAAVVNSGTATLETALIGCPQTAVYHVAGSKYLEKLLRPILFRIPHFTLVNIIPNQEIIQELIASRFTTENVAHELHRLLYDQEYRTNMLKRYQQLHTILGNASAANNAADKIYTLIFNCNETNH
ncbi:MAG: lipid-A-disaccharide synthase [Paludibacteraceae bacterium]|nr:lipid-A-disaccharide synthase [Paludibacteraceae bacterium]